MVARQQTPEFCAEALRIALVSALAGKQVAAGLGVGFSVLNRWIQQQRRDPILNAGSR
ncbi:hypothetical protein I5535_19105 [Rhodobacteraceae bacterium F11138]|nr:hypothetical protein [Rhodobacteraceae bacterium F11138]